MTIVLERSGFILLMSCILLIAVFPDQMVLGQGQTCETAVAVGIGHYIANGPNTGNGPSGMSCGAASGGNPAHADWYTFTPGQDGIYTITSTNDPAFTDTRLKIWTGICGSLVCFAGDDDNGAGFTSLVSECLTAGTTYYIEWDNLWTSSGFEWDITLDIDISCGQPVNDQCAGAITLNPGCVDLGTNLFATDSQPPICGSADDSISGGVWYRIIGNGESITATTCNPGTNFDTQMLLYDGTCNNLNCLEGNDDQGNPLNAACDVLGISENRASTIDWNSDVGVEYYLYVAGYGTLTGFFELSMESSITGLCSCDPPQALCRNITVGLDTSGIAVISPVDIDSNSTAPCGLLELTMNVDTFTCAEIGSNPVMLIVTDIDGDSDTCTATVTVLDAIPPVIQCPADIILQCPPDTSPVMTGIASAVDNCALMIDMTYQDTVITGSCLAEEVIHRQWTATDSWGNTSSCVQNISIVDSLPPAIISPPDTSILCGDTIDVGVASASDLCGSAVVSYLDSIIPGCNQSQVRIRTWMATDACGNTASAEQIITRIDTLPPALSVPTDVSISCGDTTHSAGIAEALDECGNASVSFSDSILTSACGLTAIIRRTWTATDACGNSTSGTQLITYLDTIPPDITVPGDVTLQCGDTSSTGSAIGTDLCGDVDITFTDSILASCGNANTILRSWTATDACGNSAIGIQWITFVDTVAPELTLPADVTLPCGDTSLTGTATGEDLCGTVNITFTDSLIAGCGNTNSIQRLWLATDACGNNTAGTQWITYVDTVSPELTLPADMTLPCGDTSTTGEASASDLCGTVNVTFTDTVLGSCGAANTLLRAWTATDACGNSIDGTQLITYIDTISPALTIPADVTLSCGDTTSTGMASGQDDCGAVEITFFDMAQGGCGGAGSLHRIWTATDACGNAASDTQIITYIDTLPPDLTVPEDVTLQCGDTSATGSATGIDLCGAVGVTFTDSIISGCGNTDTILRVWTAADACGNTTTGTQWITFIDTVAPELTLPADVTLPCGDTSLTGIATGEDLCGTVNINFTDSIIAGCGNTSSIQRLWTATDACGNNTAGTQWITYVDTVSPELTLPADITLPCGDTSTTGEASASDLCGTVNVTFSDTVLGSCGAANTLLRTWTATDACGNSIDRTQLITYIDTISPALTIPADVTLSCGDTTSTGMATGQDDCGAVEITFFDMAQGGCGGAGSLHRIWTATDACGNAVSDTQNITYIDTLPPDITVPEDVILQCGDTSATGSATGNDLCGAVGITFTDSIISGCGNTDTILRVWTATDACGNTTTGTQWITYIDTVAPELTLPADVTLPCGDTSLTGTATGEDHCGTVNITFTDSLIAGCGNTNSIQRLWLATDVCGNSTAGTQWITYVDTVSPELTLPADITLPCGDTSTTGEASASDLCGTVNVTFTDTVLGSCGAANTLLRTWTATDACGNSINGTQLITYIDTISPALTIPADVTLSCGDTTSTGMATGQDDCGEVEITFLDLAQGGCGGAGSLHRIWTATDACGNAVTDTQIITYIDTLAPDLTVPEDVTLQCSDTSATGSATGIDLCGAVGITFTDSIISGCGTTDTILRLWTATDACGNTTTGTQWITYIDTVAPELTIPADINLQCGDTSSTGLATATDLCGAVNITFTDSIIADCGNTNTILRSWTATDACGNISAGVQMITYADTIPPELAIPGDIALQCGDTSFTGLATATDLCGAVNVTFTDSTIAGCGNTSIIQRLWTATDVCGNSVNETQLITYIDTIPPELAIPADIALQCGDTSSTGLATASDLCGTVNITFTDSTISGCGNTSIIQRLWTATDACGNSINGTQLITYIDTIPPELVIPVDITLQCGDTSSTGLATATDLCGAVNITFTDSTIAGCGNTSSIQRLWTATDACGNSVNGTQLITYIDTIPPELAIPGDITLQCGDTVSTGTGSGQDLCGTVNITFTDANQVGCGNANTILRSWTATDACGNSVNGTQLITYIDTIPPDLVIPADITLQCGDTSSTGLATATDLCGAVNISFTDSTIAGCGNTSSIQRLWTATDACGNSINGTQLITYIDTIPPELVIPADITLQCGDASFTGLATATDLCGAVNVTFTDANQGGCGNANTILRSWTATDACGNSVNGTQLITYIDTIPPELAIPGDITLQCGDTVSTGTGSGQDLCGTVNITFTDANQGGCGNANTILRSWTATDACGNSVDGTQLITYIDTIPPDLVIPADITLQCGDTSSAGLATATDLCGAVNISFTDSTIAGCGNTSSIQRLWTATDACGNSINGTQLITYIDTIPPELVIPVDITLQCGDTSSTGLATATDLCGAVNISFTDSTIAGCGNTSSIQRLWTATDACGNSINGTQLITYIDTIPPELVIPVDITLQCGDTSSTGLATATDLCGAVNITFTDSTIAVCGNTNTILRSWTATDACGNSSAEMQMITYVDTIPPDLIIPGDIILQCGDTSFTGLAIATDLCGAVNITFTDSIIAGCGNTSSIQRLWTATDACGNSINGTQLITYIDTIPPDLVIPADITLQCGDTSFTGLATATDLCGAINVTFTDSTIAGCGNTNTILRSWTATDACDNSTTGGQLITFIDTVAPELMLPPDVTLPCGDTSSTGIATGLDLCGSVNITFTDSLIPGCGSTSSFQRVWLATDACGNSRDGTQWITYIDTIKPVLSGGSGDIEVFAGDSVSYSPPFATDACSPNPAVICVRSDSLSLEDPYPVGVTMIMCYAEDACGNRSDTLSIQVLVHPVPQVIYVDSSATGSQSGISWADAFDEVRDALGFAEQYPQVDSICVATGTYLPDTALGRLSYFYIRDSLVLFGGFPSGGAALANRDPESFPAILSGDIGVPGLHHDNVYHVIVIDSLNRGLVLDGFQIKDGLADGSGDLGRGSAVLVYGKAECRNVKTSGNSGSEAGSVIYVNGAGAQFTLKDCQIQAPASSNPVLLQYSSGGIFNLSGQNLIRIAN